MTELMAENDRLKSALSALQKSNDDPTPDSIPNREDLVTGPRHRAKSHSSSRSLPIC
jgi:hypothetical protein